MKFLISNYKELNHKELTAVNGGSSSCSGSALGIPGYIPKYHENVGGSSIYDSNDYRYATVRSCSLGNGIGYTMVLSSNNRVVYNR